MATIKSIEEKAKAYDKAIEGIQKYVKDDYGCIRLRPEGIFPELKESEDEMMIQYFKDLAPFDKAEELYEKYGFSHKDAIAWLEKQGEHKKFRDSIQVGDKVTRNEDGVLVNLSQLNRVAKKQGEQKPAEWSEEDEMILSDIIKDLVHPWNEYIPDRIEDEIKWLKNRLKTLKDRVQPQQKQEWSEEDKKIIDRIESEFLALHRGEYKNIDFNNVDSLSVLNWVRKIKSLCFYYRWKPSDEQIKAVKEAACYGSVFSEKTIDNLISLSKQLKKLREE